MRIALGTAQFGLDYGISNKQGKVSLDDVKDLLQCAREQGVNSLDTACAYGDAENVLGELGASKHFEIITKIPGISGVKITERFLEELDDQFKSSLGKLNRINTLLIHNPDDLRKEGSELLWEWLDTKKRQGCIQKYGVSVYTANDIDLALSQASFDVIQLPINIFDQRLLQSGHLEALKHLGVEIHARSIFLQGLVFMGDLNAYFDPVRQQIGDFHILCNELEISPLEMAIAFIKQVKHIDQLVVGATSVEELRGIVMAFNSGSTSLDLTKMAIDRDEFINPAKWELV